MSFLFAEGIRRTGRLFKHLEKWTLVGLVVFLAVFSLMQIVLRNFFSTSFVWGDTLLRHAVLWASLLGAARATVEGKHIRIDLLPRIMPGRTARYVSFVTNLFALSISILLLYASWNFVSDERLAGSIAFREVPYWWLEVVFPFSFAMMALRFGFKAVEDLVRNAKELERGLR